MNDKSFSDTLRRQYQIALKMLRNTIEKCPDSMWDAGTADEAPFWRQVLHVLFFTRLYASEKLGNEETADNSAGLMRIVGAPLKDFSDSEQARLRAVVGSLMARGGENPPRVPTRAELVERLDKTQATVELAMQQIAGGGADDRGPMEWVPGSRADLLLYSLRHTAHHIGQMHSYLGRRGIKLEWM